MAKIELNQMTNKEKTILVFVFQKHDRFWIVFLWYKVQKEPLISKECYVMILLFCCWPIEYWPWLNENNNHNAKKEIIFKVKKNWITTIKRREYKQWWYIVYLKNILYCFLSGMFFFDFFQGVFHQEDTTLVAA